MTLREKINDQNVFLRLAAQPPAFQLLTNFSPLEFRNDLLPLIEETYFDLRSRQSGKLSRLPPKPLVAQTWAPMSKTEKVAWEAELTRLIYHQAEAVALVEKARRAAEARQIILREELRVFLQGLTKAERKALEAAENKYRDELPNVLLLYFFRRRFNLTFECLAQLFGFKHRSSAVRHFEQAHQLMEEVTHWKTLPLWLSRKVEKSITAKVAGNPFGFDSKKISSLEQLIKTESAFSVLSGHSSIKPLHPAKHKSSDINVFRPRETLSPKHFLNDSTALQMIIKRRWGNQIRCPDCQSRKIYRLEQLRRGGAAAEESAAGFNRLKCGHSQCGKVFLPFSRTRLASCRLAPSLVLKAVYLAATCSRARHYTIEKYAAEIGITAKTARRLVALLDQFPDSANEHQMSRTTAEPTAETRAENIPHPKNKPRNFYQIRQRLPASADDLLAFLLKKPHSD